MPSGYFHVVGEVKNNGDVWLESVMVTATLKDQNGATVASPHAYTFLDHLPPNAAAAFDVFEVNTSKTMLIKSYSLSLTFSEGPPIPVLLRVVNTTATTSTSGLLGVSVEVDNLGDSVAREGVGVVTFYSADGSVVYVGSLHLPSFAPGGSVSFYIGISDPVRARLATDYRVAVESPPYTSIPELTWQPEIVLAGVLILGCIATRRRCRDQRSGQLHWDNNEGCPLRVG